MMLAVFLRPNIVNYNEADKVICCDLHFRKHPGWLNLLLLFIAL
jgi:hypothetical protein